MRTEVQKSICVVLGIIFFSGCASRKVRMEHAGVLINSLESRYPCNYKKEKRIQKNSNTKLKENEKVKDEGQKYNEGDEDSEGELLLAKDQSLNVQDYLLNGVAMPGQNKIAKGNVYYLKDADHLHLQYNYFDIPVVYNKQVKKWIDYFSNRGRKFFELYTERAGRYAPIIGSILEKNGLPRDLIFLAMAESGFNNSAKSRASAVGPWQFMPATGRLYSLTQDWYVDERKDPIKATVAAAQYLAKLYDDFGDWEVATAAYNAGEGKLGRAIKKYRTTDFWNLSKGRYLKNETKNYVPKIMALAIMGKNLKTFGFNDIDFHTPLDFKEIIVKPRTDIFKLSKALNINVQEIQKLNPELLRWFTPPNVDHYKLRLPPISAELFASCCSKQDLVATDFQEFIVRKKGMSLSQISRKFRIKNLYVLSQLNSVSLKAHFRKGAKVKLPFRLGERVIASNRLYADLFETKKSKRRNIRKIKKIISYHMVKRGESLHSIARKHNMSVRRLIAANSSISYSKILHTGIRLVIR